MARFNKFPGTVEEARQTIKEMYDVASPTENGCLELPRKYRRGGGYAYWEIRGERYTAHRLMWTALNGDIEPGLHVRHTCDNPPCVEPRHLRKGTNYDNVLDKLERGRHPRGEKASGSKLTEQDVKNVIMLVREKGLSQRSVGRIFGIHHKQVQRILAGIDWAHLAK